MTKAAILEATPCAPLPATTAAYVTLLPVDASVIPCAMIPTGVVIPNPTLAASPSGATHATPQTVACPAPATPTTGTPSQESQANPRH